MLGVLRTRYQVPALPRVHRVAHKSTRLFRQKHVLPGQSVQLDVVSQLMELPVPLLCAYSVRLGSITIMQTIILDVLRLPMKPQQRITATQIESHILRQLQRMIMCVVTYVLLVKLQQKVLEHVIVVYPDGDTMGLGV